MKRKITDQLEFKDGGWGGKIFTSMMTQATVGEEEAMSSFFCFSLPLLLPLLILIFAAVQSLQNMTSM